MYSACFNTQKIKAFLKVLKNSNTFCGFSPEFLIEAIKEKRAAADKDFVAYLIIAFVVLAIGILAYLIFSGKLANMGEFIKNMFSNLLGG